MVAAPQSDGLGLCRRGCGTSPRSRASAPEPVSEWDRVSAPLEILPADYEAFERLLGDIQAAWSNEDIARLHTLATPEMVSYFTKDLDANRARNVVNKVSDTKLLQGDLAEAWREGETDYASVAMRYSLVDKTIDRASGRLVEGSERRRKRPKSGHSCGRAAAIGNCRRSSRPDLR